MKIGKVIAALIGFTLCGQVAEADSAPIVHSSATLAQETIGLDGLSAAAHQQAVMAPASISKAGYYEGILRFTRVKAKVTARGVQLRCTYTGADQFNSAFVVEEQGQKVTLYSPSGLALKGRSKGSSLTAKTKVGNEIHTVKATKVTGVSAAVSITIEQKVQKGAACLYSFAGTFSRY